MFKGGKAILQRAIDSVVDRLLLGARGAFSPVYFEMHRTRVARGMMRAAGCLAFASVAAVVAGVPVFLGMGSVLAASCAAAVLVYVLLGVAFGVPDTLYARVLPYFERELGGTDTWLAGKHLLWNSARLDARAADLGLAPLSAFASGDPLVPGESLVLYAAAEALPTVEALLGDHEAGTWDAGLAGELEKLRDALRIAAERDVPFCLHLREGSSASGHEMSMRSGSYY